MSILVNAPGRSVTGHGDVEIVPQAKVNEQESEDKRILSSPSPRITLEVPQFCIDHEDWLFSKLNFISGILFFGIPLEELIWAMTFGALWAPLYEIFNGYKNI